MKKDRVIYRCENLAVEIANHRLHIGKVVTKSLRILEESAGQDTFLGRQNYKPIPLPHQEE